MIADVKGYIRPTHYTTASLGGLTFDAFARRQKSYAAWSKELLESLENSCLDIGGTLSYLFGRLESSVIIVKNHNYEMKGSENFER